MTYEEARAFISEANQYGTILGIETIIELLNRLGKPQDKLKVIHIAGTNGKGSVGAFITSILACSGYKVGRYISPVVYTYREIIQISERNDKDNLSNKLGQTNLDEIDIVTNYISREAIVDTIEIIEPICRQMVEDGFNHPTSFEIETTMAFLYLLSMEVDYLILETGMGGRLDATNVVDKPLCTIITSIGMDHMSFLGESLSKVAAVKADIIKSECPVLTCDQKLEVMKVLEEKVDRMKAPFIITNIDKVRGINYHMHKTSFSYLSENNKEEYQIRLLGKYQVGNALIAIETARLLNRIGHSIADDAIRQGLYNTKWHGRFEQISKAPDIFIDGAHNEEAALSLQASIEIYFTNRRLIFMIGVLADKDYKSILRILAPMADTIITLTPANQRSLPSYKLADEARAYCERVFDENDLDCAIRRAYIEAEEGDVIIAFGSLSFLGSLVSILKARKDEGNDR